MKKKNKWLPIIIVLCLIVLLPLAVGLPLFFAFGDLIYLEVFYVITGLFLWLAVTIRIRLRDSVNYKANKSIYEDKTTKDYKDFKKTQYTLMILGLIDLAISFIVYLISFYCL